MGLTDDEIDWCKANPGVRVGAAALALYCACEAGIDRRSALVDAIEALRRHRPRPRLIVDNMYVYVMRNPSAPGEGIPAMKDATGMRLLVGCDKARMRAYQADVRMVEKATGQVCSLWRFGFDRVVTPEVLAVVPSFNETLMRCVEVFAFVGRDPRTGDELLTALPTPTGIEQLVHGHVSEIRRMAADLSKVPGSEAIEIRRFVRKEPVLSLAV